MKHLFVVAFLCLAGLQLLAQHPPSRDEKHKKIPQRQEIGKGKPRLFGAASPTQPQRSFSPADISRILNNAFDNSAAGDTISVPFNSRKNLRAVIVAVARKSEHVSVMNLKVINYQNAFMRLMRNTSGGKTAFKGLVHHPDFSDALTLQSQNGTVSFQAVEQSNLINE